MLSNCIIDIEKEVGKHIELAKSLTERNELLSSKVVDLELQLKERDRELQKERRTVESHLQDKTKQSAEIERLKNRCEKLEKDMTLMIQTAQETKNSSVVSNFSSAMTMNLQNISQLEYENEQLKSAVEIFNVNRRNTDRLIEQNNTLIQKMIEERDQLKIELSMAREREQSSRLFSEQLSNNQLLQLNNKMQHEDQPNAHQEQLKQLLESLRRKKHELLREQREGAMQRLNMNRITGEFLFVCNSSYARGLLSDNVKHIHYANGNLDSLVHRISSFRKELFILTDWEYIMNTTGKYAEYYANLLSLCQGWKKLRPDGELHCLYCYREDESPSEPSKELASLLTTYNKYLDTGRATDISAIRQYWPNFADLILSEKIKNEYPA